MRLFVLPLVVLLVFSTSKKHEKSHAKAREKSEESGPRSAFWVGLSRCFFVPWVRISLLFLVLLVVNCAERALAHGLEFPRPSPPDAKRQGQSKDKNREGIWVGFAGAILMAWVSEKPFWNCYRAGVRSKLSSQHRLQRLTVCDRTASQAQSRGRIIINCEIPYRGSRRG